MIFKGIIKFQKEVFADKQECYGCVRVNDNKFRVLIAKCAGENIKIFVETIFHELLHLGCFVVIAITRAKISERQQHEMINRVMPEILQPKFLKILQGGKR
jgi:hypothetical protein